MARIQMDELDRALVDLLAKDARVSNRRIAADLGVTEGTVRGRIKRLQNDGLISFTAITSFSVAQQSNLAFISVQAEVDNVRAIARQIADIDLINAVMITMGQFNILAMCLIDDLNILVTVASDQILAIPGVHHVETSIAVKTMKYDTRLAKITASA